MLISYWQTFTFNEVSSFRQSIVRTRNNLYPKVKSTKYRPPSPHSHYCWCLFSTVRWHAIYYYVFWLWKNNAFCHKYRIVFHCFPHYLHPFLISDMTHSCTTFRKCTENVSWKCWTEESTWQTYEFITLYHKSMVCVWTGLIWLRAGPSDLCVLWKAGNLLVWRRGTSLKDTFFAIIVNVSIHSSEHKTRMK